MNADNGSVTVVGFVLMINANRGAADIRLTGPSFVSGFINYCYFYDPWIVCVLLIQFGLTKIGVHHRRNARIGIRIVEVPESPRHGPIPHSVD